MRSIFNNNWTTTALEELNDAYYERKISSPKKKTHDKSSMGSTFERYHELERLWTNIITKRN